MLLALWHWHSICGLDRACTRDRDCLCRSLSVRDSLSSPEQTLSWHLFKSHSLSQPQAGRLSEFLILSQGLRVPQRLASSRSRAGSSSLAPCH
eukprot:1825132-Rhodomonas_salina.1